MKFKLSYKYVLFLSDKGHYEISNLIKLYICKDKSTMKDKHQW